MSKSADSFERMRKKSQVRVVNNKIVEVTDPNGDVYEVMTRIGSYTDDYTRKFFLDMLAKVFDDNVCDDKERMWNSIMRDCMLNGLGVIGYLPGTRNDDRIRIGQRIRQMREENRMEAQELAKRTGIDAANICRIENGRYSVGLDILSKIAAALGKKVDFIDL